MLNSFGSLNANVNRTRRIVVNQCCYPRSAFLQGPAAERASIGEEKQLHHLRSPVTGEGGRVTPETLWLGILGTHVIKRQKMTQ